MVIPTGVLWAGPESPVSEPVPPAQPGTRYRDDTDMQDDDKPDHLSIGQWAVVALAAAPLGFVFTVFAGWVKRNPGLDELVPAGLAGAGFFVIAAVLLALCEAARTDNQRMVSRHAQAWDAARSSKPSAGDQAERHSDTARQRPNGSHHANRRRRARR